VNQHLSDIQNCGSVDDEDEDEDDDDDDDDKT